MSELPQMTETAEAVLPSSDKLAEEIHIELEEFRNLVMTGDYDSMSNKEVRRYADSLRKVLIATVENPLELTQELNTGEIRVANIADGIKQKYVLLTMMLASEDKKGA